MAAINIRCAIEMHSACWYCSGAAAGSRCLLLCTAAAPHCCRCLILALELPILSHLDHRDRLTTLQQKHRHGAAQHWSVPLNAHTAACYRAGRWVDLVSAVVYGS